MATYTMTEFDQVAERVAEYVEMFRDCPDDVPAIVVIDGAIVDGHHRYLASQIVGVEVAVSTMTLAQRDAVLALTGDDVMAVATTAHYLSGNYTAIDWIAAQFPGADVYGEAEELAAQVG